jgi:prepilin-type processing-associated H-X9-DG protein
VLFVIFLLFALFMPALSRTRRYASREVCSAHLHGLSAAVALYLNDSEGVFPEGPHGWLYANAPDSADHPLGCRWHDRAMAPSEGYQGKMRPYFNRGGPGLCPEFRRFATSRGCENPNHNRRLAIRPQYSYTINGYLGSSRAGGVSKASEVRDPSSVFFFAEENSWSLRSDHPKFPARWLSAPLSTKALDDTVLTIEPSPTARDCFATYHDAPSGDINRGSGNVVFVDGHTDSIRAEDQLRPTMHGGASRLGPGGSLHWAWASKTPPPGGWDAQ